MRSGQSVLTPLTAHNSLQSRQRPVCPGSCDAITSDGRKYLETKNSERLWTWYPPITDNKGLWLEGEIKVLLLTHLLVSPIRTKPSGLAPTERRSQFLIFKRKQTLYWWSSSRNLEIGFVLNRYEMQQHTQSACQFQMNEMTRVAINIMSM